MALKPRTGNQYVISSGEWSAVVTELGASLRELKWRGEDLIVPFDPNKVIPCCNGWVLAPYPNRVTNGQYSFDGEDYQMPIDEFDRQSSLHGYAYRYMWELVDLQESHVTLSWRSPDIAGYPFVLWLISGIVPWFYMSEMLTLGTECILRNRYLVTKMKYPVSTIPTFTSISKFFVHLILLVLTMLIFILTGHMPTVYMLQIPFYMLCNFLFFTGWALFAAPIAAISTDFSNLVKSFVTAVFWLSGILWEVDSMHDKLAHQLLMLNPVTFICNGYRNCFIYETWFFEQPKRLLYFAVALVLIYALGFWSYRRTRSEMADVL